MKSLLPKFKSKKELPTDCSCRNCHTQLISRYCHNCGQDYFSGSEKTVGEILYNTVDTVFAWDNKIFKTLKYLIFFPGKLTKEFFSGRVVQYVYPAKLFWFITILFFASFNIGSYLDDYTDDGDDEEIAEVAAKGVAAEEKSAPIEYVDTPIEYVDTPIQPQETTKAAKKEISQRQRDQIVAKVKQHFVDYIPYVMFLLVPFFAFLLFILFYKKKKYYASHMIFALHFHSFVFLFFTLYILVSDFIPETWENATYAILSFLPAVYFAIAIYVAYRPSIPKLIWKIPFVMVTYGIVCLLAIVLFVLLMVKVVEITQGVEIF